YKAHLHEGNWAPYLKNPLRLNTAMCQRSPGFEREGDSKQFGFEPSEGYAYLPPKSRLIEGIEGKALGSCATLFSGAVGSKLLQRRKGLSGVLSGSPLDRAAERRFDLTDYFLQD